MQDKNGLGEAMGRQDLALLHFTTCPAETFVFRAFVPLSPRPLASVPSEQTTPGGLLSHQPGPWVMEGRALFLGVSCMRPFALSLPLPAETRRACTWSLAHRESVQSIRKWCLWSMRIQPSRSAKCPTNRTRESWGLSSRARLEISLR